MDVFTTRIFFGHQSVGTNILNGVNEILADNEKLKFVESRDLEDIAGPCFYHCTIGTNRDPISKINDFVTLMHNSFGNNVDLACFKFCYIDIQESTNVEHLFDIYRNQMNALTQTYQNTTFLHITVPLRTAEHGLRRIAKRLLGRESIAVLKNLKRQAFNELMIQEYHDAECLFDLAGVESTYPNGKRCINYINGTKVYSLVPQYTDDGGHLNECGGKFVATKFLDTLKHLPYS